MDNKFAKITKKSSFSVFVHNTSRADSLQSQKRETIKMAKKTTELTINWILEGERGNGWSLAKELFVKLSWIPSNKTTQFWHNEKNYFTFFKVSICPCIYWRYFTLRRKKLIIFKFPLNIELSPGSSPNPQVYYLKRHRLAFTNPGIAKWFHY